MFVILFPFVCFCCFNWLLFSFYFTVLCKSLCKCAYIQKLLLLLMIILILDLLASFICWCGVAQNCAPPFDISKKHTIFVYLLCTCIYFYWKALHKDFHYYWSPSFSKENNGRVSCSIYLWECNGNLCSPDNLPLNHTGAPINSVTFNDPIRNQNFLQAAHLFPTLGIFFKV